MAASSLLLAFLLVLTSLGGRVLGYLGEAAAGDLSATLVWTLAACRLPEFLQLVLPLAVFLGTALTVGRAQAENELSALEAAGVSPAGTATRLCVVAILPALCVAGLSLGVTPRAQALLQERLDVAARDVAEALLRPGEFLAVGPGRTLFVGAMDPGTRVLRELLIVEGLDAADDGTLALIRARRAEQLPGAMPGERVLELQDAVRWQLRIGARDVQRVRFARLRWRLPSIARAGAPAAALPSSDLWRRYHAGALVPAHLAELGWRLSLPLACWLAVPLALALGRGRPRWGRFDRLPVALACFLAYFGLLLLLRSAVARGLPWAVMALLLAHASVALLAGWLLWRRQRWAT